MNPETGVASSKLSREAFSSKLALVSKSASSKPKTSFETLRVAHASPDLWDAPEPRPREHTRLTHTRIAHLPGRERHSRRPSPRGVRPRNARRSRRRLRPRKGTLSRASPSAPLHRATDGGDRRARASPDADADADAAAVARETSLFESFTAIPFVAGATLAPDPEGEGMTLHVQTAQRNLASDDTRRSVAAVPLPASLTSGASASANANDAFETLRHPSFGMEERGVCLSSVSPSGRRRLVARDAKDAGGDRGAGIALEVWEGGALVSETIVSPKTHGALCADGTFGGVSWSALETRVAYVAEAPDPAAQMLPEWGMGVTKDARDFFARDDTSAGDLSSKQKKDEETNTPKRRPWRGRGEWREDWGEQLVGKIEPTVYVLETESSAVGKVEGLPRGAVAASGPAWAPASAPGAESDQLVCAAWLGDMCNFKSTSRRLGLVFCFNRPSGLFLLDAPSRSPPAEAETDSKRKAKEALPLTADVSSALWPRFSPDGATLAYVSHARAVATGAHAATCALRVIDWTAEGKPSRDVLGVADFVDDAAEARGPATARGAFPGLYASAPLAADPWLGNDALVLQTTWGAGEAIVRVDVPTGEVTRLTPPRRRGRGTG